MDIRKIPIYCINLDKRPERLRFFMNQPGLQPCGLRPKRVSAVDGTTLNIVSDRRISNRTKYNILHKTRRSHDEIDTAGAIGCSLSHYEVWKKFLETKSEFCLVLEDDAQIPVGLADMILGVGPPPPDFDIWSLSYRLYDPTLLPLPLRLPLHSQDKWKIPVNFWGTAAYIISRRGAERMMDGFFPIECHLDRYMSIKSLLGSLRLVVNTDVKTYTLHQGTDIQLNNCALCNYPNTFDGFLVDKYEMRVGLACSIFLTILLLVKINNDS